MLCGPQSTPTVAYRSNVASSLSRHRLRSVATTLQNYRGKTTKEDLSSPITKARDRLLHYLANYEGGDSFSLAFAFAQERVVRNEAHK